MILKQSIDLQVIIAEASKISGDLSKNWKQIAPSMARMPTTTEGPGVLKSQSINPKVIMDPLHTP